jgi:hypothetical protein
MKFQMTELVNTSTFTARLGAGTGAANFLDDVTEKGKFVKLIAESRYGLAIAGDEIEGTISSINAATADGYSLGAVTDHVGAAKFLKVTADGLQATPGVGVIAVGDYVLVGTPAAKGTKLTEAPRVVKATTQATAKSTPFAWRAVSLGSAGTGAVGTQIVIQRAGA